MLFVLAAGILAWHKFKNWYVEQIFTQLSCVWIIINYTQWRLVKLIKIVVTFWAFRLVFLSGFVKIKEHVGAMLNFIYYKIYLKVYRLEKFHLVNTPYFSITQLHWFFFYYFCHWLFPKNLYTDNMLLIFQFSNMHRIKLEDP